jgi:hypothetical protein
MPLSEKGCACEGICEARQVAQEEAWVGFIMSSCAKVSKDKRSVKLLSAISIMPPERCCRVAAQCEGLDRWMDGWMDK